MRLMKLTAFLSAISVIARGDSEVADGGVKKDEDLNGMTKFIRQKAVHHDAPFVYSMVKQQVPVEDRWHPGGYYHSNSYARAGNYWAPNFVGGAVGRMARPYVGAYDYGLLTPPVIYPRNLNPYEFYGIEYPWEYLSNYGAQRAFYPGEDPIVRVPLSRSG